MPPAAARAPRGAAVLESVVRHPVALWIGFVLAHLWLGLLGLYAPGQPLGDVTGVYRFWVEHGFTTGQWVGIDTSWVYPVLALLPMLAASAFGLELYASTWLSLVMLLDAAAFAVLLAVGGRGIGARRVAGAAWWWIGFLVALGPVALGRIDAITVAVALAALLVLPVAPRLAGALLTIGAWLKVWPAALVAAVVLVVRDRVGVVIAAAVTSVVVLAGAIAVGGGGTVLSFLGEQTGRGLQIEAVVATPWMWHAFAGGPGASTVYYDAPMLTFQLRGPGVAEAAALTTPLLAIAVVLLLGLALLALRRGAPVGELLPPLALAITTALIVFNKVGSPQFAAWLAVPIVAGLVAAARREGSSFGVPATLGLIIAIMTQAIYPYLYHELLALDIVLLVLLTARNLLYLVLLAWALWTLAGLLLERRGDAAHPAERGWMP